MSDRTPVLARADPDATPDLGARTGVPAPDVGASLVIDGRYRVVSKIGEGGMGTVLRVEHVRMGKIMALKLLRPDLAEQRSIVERFRREAQTMSKLDHPNVITVFDSGETDTGALYLVMEYVPGRDLAQILRAEGPMPERRALRLVIQVLRALAEAHAHGIVHRDIKPANIMLTSHRSEADVVKVLDFGIAKLAEGKLQGTEVTGESEIVGTPACMSPEQIRGEELDPTSDIYSVSALLFELLAGRGPFVGSGLEVVSQHLVTAPPSILAVAPSAAVSPEVERIVARGLSKDRSKRHPSADAMRIAIEHALIGSTTSEPDVNIARREDWDAFEDRFKRRRSVERTVALGLVAGVLALAYVGIERSAEAPVERRPVTREVEPNDLLDRANLITPGAPVLGHIGARTTAAVSDRDVFEIAVPTDGSILSVGVSAVPNINLVVEVFRSPRSGEIHPVLIAAIDDAPISTSEELSDVPLDAGRHLVRVSDRRRLDEDDGAPRENSFDAYGLNVAIGAPRPYQEREPNNEPSHPMAVTIETPVLGVAGTPGLARIVRDGDAPLPTWAVDVYRVDGEAAACAVMTGLPFATLRVSALSAARRKVGSQSVTEGRAAAVCGKALFEVRVDNGSTGRATYPIAFVADRPGGGAGLDALAKHLVEVGRENDANLLLAKAREVAPRAF
jgi:serine/threonine-protein kinase